MPRAKRKPPSVYVVEAIVTAIAEGSMDVMTGTNVMFSLFNVGPSNDVFNEEDSDAKASTRRVKAKADRVGADSTAGEAHLFGDKL